ncbi:MAG: methyltransferase domain-containing protein [Pyrinomonadaceae bacterium]
MSLTKEPQFNVESLVAQMREGLQGGGARTSSATDEMIASDGSARSMNSSSTHLNGQPTETFELAPLALQPSFEARADDSYHVRDLLLYHDRNFIQNAYRAILKRGPDATGYRAFLEGLHSGRLNKIDILARLRFSSEGRAKKVQVKGLFFPAAVRQAYRVPVLGYLLNLFIGIARLPNAIRHAQQFEAHTLAQHEQLADYANKIGAHLSAHTKEVNGILAQQSQALRDLMDQQKSLQENLLRHLLELQHHLETNIAELRRHLETRLDEEGASWRSQVDDVTARLDEESARRREDYITLVQKTRADIERNFERQQQLRSELTLHGERVTRLLEEARKRLPPAPLDTEQLQKFADEEQHALDAFYVSFEDQFRGTRLEIKERLRIYLPILRDGGIGTAEMSVLDVGSGRGEWLELLKDEGLRARGVDLNRVLAETCRARGLNVVERDVLEYLRELPDESVGAVTGFHIIEHLPVDVLIKMLDETMRVVKRGGLVLFETPNPQNVLVGSCNFYFDPTHRNPLPSPIMQFLVESRGFARARIINLNPSDAEPVTGDSDLVKRFNQYFYGPMDYAVIGWKT